MKLRSALIVALAMLAAAAVDLVLAPVGSAAAMVGGIIGSIGAALLGLSIMGWYWGRELMSRSASAEDAATTSAASGHADDEAARRAIAG